MDLESLRGVWPAVLEQLSSGALGAFLAEALPVEVTDDELRIAWADHSALLMKQADRPANREALATAVRTVTGRALRLQFELRAEDELQLVPRAEEPVLSEDELVARFVEEFDATVLTDEEDPA